MSINGSRYPVPASSLERLVEVRKSRFIARVAPVSSRDEVHSWLEGARRDHPDASHICWAYQIGQPGAAAEAAMNDDGEPSGTAGRPILGVIQHKDMGDVLVIVIRYFGGVRLGAGGLVRAYAGAAEAVLSAVGRKVPPALTRVRLQLDFSAEQPVRHWGSQHGAHIVSVEYGTSVRIRLDVPEEHLDLLRGFCGSQGMDFSLER